MSAIIENLWSDVQEYTRLQPEALNNLLHDAAGLTLERWQKIKPTTPEEKINFYALYAFELFEGAKRHLQPARVQWFHELIDMAKEGSWRKVLDFGCGIGTDGLVLAEAGLEVHFLDVVNSAFNFARWRAVKYGFENTRFFPLQRLSQKYDCIICVDVLGHTANPRETIRELMRWTHNLWLLDNIHEGHEDYHENVHVVYGPLASRQFNQMEPHLWIRKGIALNIYIIPEFGLDSSGGVAAHIRGLKNHLPKFGVELVDSIDEADLVHVQATGESPQVDIYTSHGGFLPHDDGLIADIVAKNLTSAKRVITIGNWMAGALRDKYNVNPIVIPHGVDWEELDEVPEGEFCERFGIEPGFFLWAKCGLHDDLFNPADFIRLAEAYPEHQFVMTLFPEGQIPPANVKVMGLFRPGPAAEWKWMKRALKDCGCLVWPHIDFFPIQILEGWACSKPILGYDLGGVGEMIDHKKTGYLAPPGDFEELAKGLEYIIKHGKELGEAGRREVERNYHWQSVAQRTADLYEEVFEEKRRARVSRSKSALASKVASPRGR